MNAQSASFALLLTMVLASCTGESPSITEPAFKPAFSGGGGQVQCQAPAQAAKLTPRWSCNTDVDVVLTFVNNAGGTIDTTFFKNAAKNALSAWNAVLSDKPGYSGLPTFNTTSIAVGNPGAGAGDNNKIEIRTFLQDVNGTEVYCGEFDNNVTNIQLIKLFRDDLTGCTEGVPDTKPDGVIAHEVGNVFGFKDFNEAPTTDCIMNTPGGYPTPHNTVACQHERQTIYYSYGFRSTEPSFLVDLVSQVSANPSALALSNGQIDTVVATTAGVPLAMVQPARIARPFLSSSGSGAPSVNFTWSIADRSIASFVSPPRADTAVVQADPSNVGQTTLTITVQPDTNVVWPDPAVDVPITVGAGPDTSPPTQPGQPVEDSITATQVDISWSPASDPESGIDSYKIRRGGVIRATVSGSTTSYSDQTVSPSTTYAYKVQAVNGAGLTGPLSPGRTVNTPALPFVQSVVIMPAPVNLTQSQQTRTVTAEARDANNKMIPGVTFNWLMFNTNTAVIIGQSQGVSSVTVDAENNGSTKIQATPTIPGNRKRVNVNVNCGGPCF